MTQAYKKAKAEDESLFGAEAGGPPTTVVTKKKKRSLIREQYYEEFSTEFWKEPGICTVWLFFCVICVYFDKSRIFSLKYLLFLGTQRNLNHHLIHRIDHNRQESPDQCHHLQLLQKFLEQSLLLINRVRQHPPYQDRLRDL